MKMKSHIKYILFLSAAVFLSGCLRDTHEAPGKNNDYVAVELIAGFENEGEVVSRALSADQENHVENIDVLVFEYDTAIPGSEKFLYATHGYDIRNTAGSNAKTFKAMLATGINDGGTEISLVGKQVFLMVLANSRDIWNSVSASVSRGDGIQGVMDKLIYHVPGKWDASPTSTQYFPMSSMTSTVVTMSGNLKGSDFGPLDLVRAVVAIDVGFNYNAGTPSGFDNFKLAQVALCRFPDRGYVSGVYGYDNIFVSRQPGSRTLINRTYTLGAPSKYGMFSEMYLPLLSYLPLAAASYDNVEEGYVLIGGYYSEGGSENTSDLTWYRVGSENIPGLSLERNYRYTFKIQSIDGSGFATPEEAAAGIPNMWANMTVVPWSESRHDADIEGPYKFDISQREFYLDNDARTDGSRADNILSLYTDYLGGWGIDEITYEVDPGSDLWLSTDITNGVPFVTNSMLIKTKENTAVTTRTGYIHLSAGHWKYTVKVQQSYMPRLSVTPASRTISFWSHLNGAMPSNTFVVESDNEWSISSVTYPSGTNWGLTAQKTADGTGFYVQCAANSSSGVRNAVVNVTSAGRTVSVPITQDWVNCGISGVTKNVQFGATTVKTHLIGGNPRDYMIRASETLFGKPYAEWRQDDKEMLLMTLVQYPYGDNYSCWMVENSSYGTWNTDMYNGSVQGGPYYSPANAATACPEGWRLPDYEDLIGLRQLYTASQLGPDAYLGEEIHAAEAFLSNGDTYHGGYNVLTTTEGWRYRGEFGFFMSGWNGIVTKEYMNANLMKYPDVFSESDYKTQDEREVSAASSAVFLQILPDGHLQTGFTANYGGSPSPGVMMPVRCVVDKKYHYE